MVRTPWQEHIVSPRFCCCHRQHQRNPFTANTTLCLTTHHFHRGTPNPHPQFTKLNIDKVLLLQSDMYGGVMAPQHA